MVVVERMIQEICPGKFEALQEIDKRYDPIEKELGFPPKKRFWSVSGGPYDSNTLILEREWESMAALEATYERAFQNADIQALNEEGAGIVKSSRMEFFTPLP